MKRPQETNNTKQESYISPQLSSAHARSSNQSGRSEQRESESQSLFTPPSINLPKGGGAIQGIGEKFQANPVTGTGSMMVPIVISPGRGGFTPQLILSYDSGAGNSVFGLGWNIGLPSITRKTQTGLPQYDGSRHERPDDNYTVFRYRPRIEDLFARIEKWVDNDSGEIFWKSVTKENITTIYGQAASARIFDPADCRKDFKWLIERSYDDKGNVICYQYKKEDSAGFDSKPIFKKNRGDHNKYRQAYLKRVWYCNIIPYHNPAFSSDNEWLFELVLDYGEHLAGDQTIPTFEEQQPWPVRSDIFSSFRSGFYIRTYCLCRRILMFHHFEEELGVKNYLVKATHLEYDENPIATQLKSVTHTGYRIDEQGEYTAKTFAPVIFYYTKAKIAPNIYEIHAEDLPNAPEDIGNGCLRLIDLDSNAIPDIFISENDCFTWFPPDGKDGYQAARRVGEALDEEKGPRVVFNEAFQTILLADMSGDGLTDIGGIRNGQIYYWTDMGYGRFNSQITVQQAPQFDEPDFFDPSCLRLTDIDGSGFTDIFCLVRQYYCTLQTTELKALNGIQSGVIFDKMDLVIAKTVKHQKYILNK